MKADSATIAALLLELKQTWHQTIPVSQFMQVTPIAFDGDSFTVTAPMSPNINLHQTMFAGSIYTLMTLTGWGMLWLQQQLHGVEGNIVLADANIRYHAPITQAPVVTVTWPEFDSKTMLSQSSSIQSGSSELDSSSSHILDALHRGGKVKVNLEVKLHCDGKLCASFNGLYFSF